MCNLKTSIFKVFCALICLSLSGQLLSQQSSLGTDFWLAFNRNFDEDPNDIPPQFLDLQVFISSPDGASGTLEIEGLGFSVPFSVAAGELITIDLPDEAMITTPDGTEDLGVHVVSDNLISVYGLNQRTFSTDAYLALPVSAWGSDYLVMSYVNSPSATGSQFGIVANQDNTVVTITLTGTLFNGPLEGTTYQVTLDEGEVYQGRSIGGSDLTGTEITSTQPIGVFGSHFCATVPVGVTFCDHLTEMLPAEDAWGQSFVTVPFAERENGDVFRVLAAEDNTQVEINGSLVATLDRGEHYETILTQASSIECSASALVAQFMQGNSADGDDFVGDPAMVLIPPREQFVGEYTVSTPAAGFETNHLNLVVDNNGLGSILLNGAPIAIEEFSPIAGTNFNSAQIPIDLGNYSLTSSTAFGVFVYGTNPDDSYAYPGGQIYSAVAEVNNLSLAPDNSEAPAFSELCFEATLLNADDEPIEGVRIDFVAEGANEASGFSFTDANGVATFCYSGENEGEDILTAFQGDLVEEVTVVWTEPTFDCEGTPNGNALPGAECELDGETGVWSEECICEIDEVPCSVSLLSAEELTDGCFDDQPMLELVYDLENPNEETVGTLSIDYASDLIEDEEISVEIPAEGGEFSQMVTLDSYGVMSTIELSIGEGEEQCSVASDEIDLPVPECPVDCEGVVNGSALPGTSCSLAGAIGVWNENCECVPSEPGDCLSYRYFLANNPTGSGDSKLFEVTLDEENQLAVLEEILSLSYSFHIAYDAPANLVYIVRSSNGNFRTLDVSVEDGALSDEVVLSESLGGAVAAGFSPDGAFYIGSDDNDAIYTVNTETGEVSFFRNAPVHGGDLAFRDDGNAYLATRDFDGRVFELDTEGETSTVNNVPSLVTGLAITESGDGLVSVRDRNRLYLGDNAGNQLGSYFLVLDGELFTAGNGDMASGCEEFLPGGECPNFLTFYTGYPQNNSDNELYALTLGDDDNIELEQIEGFSLDDNHIAVSPEGLIYSVRGSMIDIFDPSAEAYVQENIPIETESGQSLSGFPAATFDFNGVLYIAKSSNNTVYSVDFVDGIAEVSVAFSNVSIVGGDLVATGNTEEQVIWYINRSQGTLTNLIDNSEIPLNLDEINGACLLSDGRLLVANGDSGEEGGLYAIDLEDFSTVKLSETGGPDIYFNGDLASGCPVEVASISDLISSITAQPELGLSIQPNPSKGITNVIFENYESKRVTIEVLDMNGRVVEVLFNQVSEFDGEQMLEFDGSSLPNGIYIVRMTSDSYQKIEKLMISK